MRASNCFNKMNLIELSTQIRVQCLKIVCQSRSSHIGSALSMTDIISVLFGSVMRLDPSEPKLPIRDRFILSKGHACVAVYSALAELGYFPKDELKNYGSDHSNFMTHISHKVPGVEFSTGSLGHGLPFAVGKALVGKKQKCDWKVYVLLGDGELAEGSNWEAALFASHHKLDNLVAIIDHNNLQSLTTVADTLGIEPIDKKFEAFGWSVKRINGHDHSEIYSALHSAPLEKGLPTMLIAKTIKGKGVSFMENSIEWHYKSPSDEQLQIAISELINA
jgi:transketolase